MRFRNLFAPKIKRQSERLKGGARLRAKFETSCARIRRVTENVCAAAISLSNWIEAEIPAQVWAVINAR